jgi:hypothetical protein
MSAHSAFSAECGLPNVVFHTLKRRSPAFARLLSGSKADREARLITGTVRLA